MYQSEPLKSYSMTTVHGNYYHNYASSISWTKRTDNNAPIPKDVHFLIFFVIDSQNCCVACLRRLMKRSGPVQANTLANTNHNESFIVTHSEQIVLWSWMPASVRTVCVCVSMTAVYVCCTDTQTLSHTYKLYLFV